MEAEYGKPIDTIIRNMNNARPELERYARDIWGRDLDLLYSQEGDDGYYQPDLAMLSWISKEMCRGAKLSDIINEDEFTVKARLNLTLWDTDVSAERAASREAEKIAEIDLRLARIDSAVSAAKIAREILRLNEEKKSAEDYLAWLKAYREKAPNRLDEFDDKISEIETRLIEIARDVDRQKDALKKLMGLAARSDIEINLSDITQESIDRVLAEAGVKDYARLRLERSWLTAEWYKAQVPNPIARGQLLASLEADLTRMLDINTYGNMGTAGVELAVDDILIPLLGSERGSRRGQAMARWLKAKGEYLQTRKLIISDARRKAEQLAYLRGVDAQNVKKRLDIVESKRKVAEGDFPSGVGATNLIAAGADLQNALKEMADSSARVSDAETESNKYTEPEGGFDVRGAVKELPRPSLAETDPTLQRCMDLFVENGGLDAYRKEEMAARLKEGERGAWYRPKFDFRIGWLVSDRNIRYPDPGKDWFQTSSLSISMGATIMI